MMRAVRVHGAPRPGRWLRVAVPAGAVLAAGVMVNASPTLRGLLVTLIWSSWLLVGLLAARAAGLRVPARVRCAALDAGRLLTRYAGRGAAAAVEVVMVQGRRLRSRLRGPERLTRSGGPR